MSDNIFDDDYVPPPKRPPTEQEIAEKKFWKGQRRILRAINENRTICERCGVRMFDYCDATIQKRRGEGRGIRGCKSSFRGCEAEAAVQALRDGPPPRVAKITPKRIAAFKKRRASH